MRLVLLGLLLAPLTASAEPVSAFLGTVLIAGITYGQVIFMSAMFLYGQTQQRRQQKSAADAAQRQRDQWAASLKDRSISGVATEFPYRYIYGQARVGANIVAMFSSGTYGEIKHIVCVIAQHEIQSIDEVYLNGNAVGALDGSGYTTTAPYHVGNQIPKSVQVSSGGTYVITDANPQDVIVSTADQSIEDGGTGGFLPLAFTITGDTITFEPQTGTVYISYTYLLSHDYLRIKKHLGAIGDAADSDLIAEVPSKWNSNCTLTGHAYAYLRIDQNLSEFQNGLPTIEFLVSGKKLYDPRTTTTTYSTNPALVIYDYLTSDLCKIDASSLPVSQYIAAANDCDDFMPSLGAARYTCNGVVTSDQPQGDVLEKLAQCMAGGVVATTWDVYAGKYASPVLTIEQEDIIGDFAVSPGYPRGDVYNTVKGQFISAANKYQSTDYIAYQNAVLVAADGEELDTNIDLPFTDVQQRVTNLCRIFVEDNRSSYSLNGKFSLKCWSLSPGNRIIFNAPFFGQSGRVFRVMDKAIDTVGGVTLALKEDASAIYDEADQVVPDQTPNTGFPNPFNIQPLESLACDSGDGQLIIGTDGTIQSRIKVAWPQAITPSVVQNGLIEVQWILAENISTGNWSSTTVPGAQTYAYLSPVTDTQIYFVRARTANPYLGLKSEWVTTTHFVLGKSSPPGNVTGFLIDDITLTWDPVFAVDLAGYKIRFQYGTNYDWNSAVDLFAGVITTTTYSMIARPSGNVTLMIKAVDTSGNESLQADSITTDLGQPDVANVVQVVQFDPAFSGTVTGGSVSGGDVCATANDSFYGSDSQSFYGLDTDSIYKASTYEQVQFISDEFTINSALAGSLMTLALSTSGTDIVVEYRVVGGGSFYGVDENSFYDFDDASAFYEGAGPWVLWPGTLVATNDVYQFRVTIGAGAEQGCIYTMALTIDAPDIVEYLSDITIGASGTIPPYTANFTNIINIQITLQANGSGAETVEVDKTDNLNPVIKAYNSAHTAVSGAKVDLTLKGY